MDKSRSAIFGPIFNTILLNYKLLVSSLHPAGAFSPAKIEFLRTWDMYNYNFSRFLIFFCMDSLENSSIFDNPAGKPDFNNLRGLIIEGGC